MSDVETNSFLELDSVLDYNIAVKEVNQTIQHLKGNYAGGADSLSPNLLNFTSPFLENGYVLFQCNCSLCMQYHLLSRWYHYSSKRVREESVLAKTLGSCII